jgi:hypothetical protein
MADYCTCGAQLAPDSLFCHKCGKPQREVLTPEVEQNVFAGDAPVSIAPPLVTPKAPEQPPVSFRNPVAVRVALTMALIATALFFLQFVNWFGAGFFAVWFYRRRTGFLMNLESGIRLGWMTGLMMSGIGAFVLTICVVGLRALGGVAALQAQFKSALDPRVVEGLKLLQNGPELVGQLVVTFFIVTCLSMVGGALGAKMVGSPK